MKKNDISLTFYVLSQPYKFACMKQYLKNPLGTLYLFFVECKRHNVDLFGYLIYLLGLCLAVIGAVAVVLNLILLLKVGLACLLFTIFVIALFVLSYICFNEFHKLYCF